MWVYHADSRRAILFGDWSTANSIGFNIELSTAHAVRFYWNGNPDYWPGEMIVGANTWSHITITYDGSTITSYLNGVKKATRSGALAAVNKVAGEFRLGRDNRTTDTALNGKLNDFRVYNHCLSPAEVHEISQGLVLHYKLDNITNGIVDSSGYGHNGEIIGTPTITSDSPRYSSSLHISATSQHIKCGVLTTSGFGNSYSFSWWGKASTFSGVMQWGFNDGIRLNGIIDGKLWNTGDSANNPLYNPGTTTQVTVPTNNEWHHFVMTGDGTTCKVYKDGVHWGTAKTYKSISGTQIYINGWANATGYCHTDLSMSDFRIYATALSADDVKQLYNTAAKVDNLHNIHTFEYIENNTSTKLTKQGQFKTQNIQENISVSLPYDKTLYTEPDGSTWIHVFHHNNPAGARFSNSADDWTNGKYIDTDKWYWVEQFLNYTPRYEFMVKQKTTSDATETKFRWIQTPNPLTATWTDVKPGTVTFITTSGYSNNSMGGMYLMKGSSLHMCIANGSNGNWYGGIGASGSFNGGIPGYPNTTITTGYIDLYLRIYPNAKIIKELGIGANNLIEK